MIARILAAPALRSADPAMRVVLGVALTLLAAYHARLPTRLQLRLRCLRVVVGLPGENAPGRVADVGAIEAQPDAPAKLDHVFLGEAGIGAGGTGLRALDACLDASRQKLSINLSRQRVGFQNPLCIAHLHTSSRRPGYIAVGSQSRP